MIKIIAANERTEKDENLCIHEMSVKIKIPSTPSRSVDIQPKTLFREKMLLM